MSPTPFSSHAEPFSLLGSPLVLTSRLYTGCHLCPEHFPLLSPSLPPFFFLKKKKILRNNLNAINHTHLKCTLCQDLTHVYASETITTVKVVSLSIIPQVSS